MAGKQISEKQFELTYTWAALQDATLTKMHFYAPTSFEEFKEGYDAKFVGVGSFRELYLQFKAPAFIKDGKKCTVQITPHQHALLRNRYPDKSAYYVFSLMPSMAELRAANAQLSNAAEMLAHYICVDASELPTNVSFLQLEVPAKGGSLPRVFYKTPDDGAGAKTATNEVPKKAVVSGRTLMRNFKTADVGHSVRLGKTAKTESASPIAEKSVVPSLLKGAKVLGRSEFGIAFRA